MKNINEMYKTLLDCVIDYGTIRQKLGSNPLSDELFEDCKAKFKKIADISLDLANMAIVSQRSN